MCHNTVEVLVECVFKRSTHTVSEQEQMDNVGCGVCDVVNNVCNAWIVEPLSFVIFLYISSTRQHGGSLGPRYRLVVRSVYAVYRLHSTYIYICHAV